jgi:hypothetical protein
MTRNMILSMLRHTNVGSCLLDSQDVLYPIQRLEGDVAQLINLLIVCHLLSGESYKNILSTDERCSSLLIYIHPGAFHFSVHSRVINEWIHHRPEKTRFQARTELLRDEVGLVRMSCGLIGWIPLNASLIRGR